MEYGKPRKNASEIRAVVRGGAVGALAFLEFGFSEKRTEREILLLLARDFLIDGRHSLIWDVRLGD